jgi:bacteriocin-like protein
VDHRTTTSDKNEGELSEKELRKITGGSATGGAGAEKIK